MTITEFIEAQLGRVEEPAREATPGPWSAADEHGLMPGATPAWCISQLTPAGAYVQDVADIPQGGDCEQADAAHIALHDPAHVLAWVAAIRAVVGMHASVNVRWPEKACGVCDEYDAWAEDRMAADWPCPTLRALAAIWAGEDGWDEAWR